MDFEFPNSIYKFQAGFINPITYGNRLGFRLSSRVTEESTTVFSETTLNSEIFDFDLDNNWLLAAHSPLHVSIYNVQRSKSDTYDCVASWKHDNPPSTSSSRRKYPYECVNWNSNNRFFTMSGRGPNVYFVDTITCQTIEEIYIPEIKKIYQHRTQPQNNASIAVASNLKHIPIIDVRSGNVSYTVKKHSSKVKSVAWSPVADFILASTSTDELYLWDTRMTKTPKTIVMDKLPPNFLSLKKPELIVPELQFIPGTNKLIGLTADCKLHVLDVDTTDLQFYGAYSNAFPNTRYKFSLVGNCDPSLLFLPAGTSIKMIELNSMQVIDELSGHFFTPKVTVFNPLKNELYSAAKDECVIWVAQRF